MAARSFALCHRLYALRLLVMPLRPQQMRRRLPLTETTLQRVARRLFRRLAIDQAFVLEVSFPLRPQQSRRRLPQMVTTLQRLDFFLRFAIVLSSVAVHRLSLPTERTPEHYGAFAALVKPLITYLRKQGTANPRAIHNPARQAARSSPGRRRDTVACAGRRRHPTRVDKARRTHVAVATLKNLLYESSRSRHSAAPKRRLKTIPIKASRIPNRRRAACWVHHLCWRKPVLTRAVQRNKNNLGHLFSVARKARLRDEHGRQSVHVRIRTNTTTRSRWNRTGTRTASNEHEQRNGAHSSGNPTPAHLSPSAARCNNHRDHRPRQSQPQNPRDDVARAWSKLDL